MKILQLNCSPHKDGNIAELLNCMGTAAVSNGAEVDTLHIDSLRISFCRGCDSCANTRECIINDDMQNVYKKIREAQAIVIGTPVYYYGMAAQAKMVIDRCIALQPSLKAKFGIIVATAGSMGISDTIKDIMMFYATKGIILYDVLGTYIPVEASGAAMKAASNIGNGLAQMLKEYADTLPAMPVNHITFGTHTK